MSMRTLKDLGKIVTGNTPKMSERENFDSADIPFIKPGDISDDSITVINKGQFFISENARDKARILPSDSILVTCIGIIGKVGILTREAAFNQQINGIVPDINSVIPRYLAYAILSQKSYLQEKANAAVVPIINKSQFSELKVEVPNLQKQNEIVRNLDKVDHLISLQKQQLKGLDELVKSRFIEMFGDPQSNCYNWKIVPLKDVMVGGALNGYFTKPQNYDIEGNVGVICVSDVVNRKYTNVNALRRAFASEKDLQKYCVKYGDMLFCRSSLVKEGIGKASIIPPHTENDILFECHVIKITLDMSRVIPEYLQALSITDFFRIQVIRQSKTATMTTIGQKDIASVNILLPPMELQKRFTEFSAQIDKSKLAVQKSLDELEILKKSLMQQYFG
ncbi:restriction endonuclease subunit S [uncultured Dialister sp.]|uniref:restriction endonuclease subunit S n=3 Tax=Dialister succinatiphilus TaxID=487173 RepID=UPI00259A5BC6|nr:restriction endonuclease subunit S [uncultured Dialister sp.]